MKRCHPLLIAAVCLAAGLMPAGTASASVVLDMPPPPPPTPRSETAAANGTSEGPITDDPRAVGRVALERYAFRREAPRPSLEALPVFAWSGYWPRGWGWAGWGWPGYGWTGGWWGNWWGGGYRISLSPFSFYGRTWQGGYVHPRLFGVRW